MEVRAVEADELGPQAAALRQLEAEIRYPLGADSFCIDHGADYALFFRRMGRARFYLGLAGGELCAVLVEVRREVEGRRLRYLADLKTRVRDPGRGWAARLLQALPPLEDGECVYGISMDPDAGQPNRVLRLLRRLHPDLRLGAALRFFTLDAARMASFAPVLASHRGALGYRSLEGIKDLILASTGQPMPLWHVQFGPTAEVQRGCPVPGEQHMFCVAAGDPLERDALAAGLRPHAAASLVCTGDCPSDWSFVLTSEI